MSETMAQKKARGIAISMGKWHKKNCVPIGKCICIERLAVDSEAADIYAGQLAEAEAELAQARQQIEELTKENAQVRKYKSFARAAERQLAEREQQLAAAHDVLREFLAIREWTIEAGGSEGPLSQDVIRKFVELQQHAIEGARKALEGKP